MNSFSKNKEIVKLCKNYYKIVNSEIYENDHISSSVINMYTDYLFGMEIVTKREKEKIVQIDNIMYKFMNDMRFKKEMLSKLSILKVSTKVNNIAEYVMNKMLEYFEEYKDTYTRSIYIPRWI